MNQNNERINRINIFLIIIILSVSLIMFNACSNYQNNNKSIKNNIKLKNFTIHSLNKNNTSIKNTTLNEINKSCRCNIQYEPVRCEKSGIIKEFANPCLASCYGFSKCTRINQKNIPIDKYRFNRCVCTELYQPVICKQNGIKRKFSNICFAHCFGFSKCTLIKN